MRRLFTGILLLAVAVFAGLPYLVDKQGAVKIFSGQTKVKLFLHGEEKVVKMPLEDYLVGVVAAEMPAEFPLEALKAQAVAARTYALKRLGAGGVANPPHPGADLCDDHRHGQAWLSREDLKERWGTIRYYQHYYKIKKAVDETRGQVLTYKGELIDPAYHASCGGRTENSEDVWKFQVPYLRSVPCPYDADPNPEHSASFRLEQVDRALGTSLHAAAASAGGIKQQGIKVVEKTSTGRPKTLAVGEKRLPAVAVRDLLGLRSTNFRFKIEADTVTFVTSGYGHGVGLCQYGAKGMAGQGYNYRTILGHYYSGVEITEMKK